MEIYKLSREDDAILSVLVKFLTEVAEETKDTLRRINIVKCLTLIERLRRIHR